MIVLNRCPAWTICSTSQWNDARRSCPGASQRIIESARWTRGRTASCQLSFGARRVDWSGRGELAILVDERISVQLQCLSRGPGDDLLHGQDAVENRVVVAEQGPLGLPVPAQERLAVVAERSENQAESRGRGQQRCQYLLVRPHGLRFLVSAHPVTQYNQPANRQENVHPYLRVANRLRMEQQSDDGTDGCDEVADAAPADRTPYAPSNDTHQNTPQAILSSHLDYALCSTTWEHLAWPVWAVTAAGRTIRS